VWSGLVGWGIGMIGRVKLVLVLRLVIGRVGTLDI